MKRIICFLTAFVMTLSLITPTAFAEGIDLDPDPFDSVIELNEEIAINLTQQGDSAEYTFTPETTGYYVLYTLDDASFSVYIDEEEGGYTLFCSGATLGSLYKFTAGVEYTLTFSYQDEASAFDFAITDLKIESVEITDAGNQTYVYGLDSTKAGEEGSEYDWYYVDEPDEIKVTFNNGDEPYTGEFSEVNEYLTENYHIDLGIYSDQSFENQWKAGNTYQAYVIIGIITDDTDIMFPFDVEIVDNPVATITTSGETPTIYENINGYEDEDGDFYYNPPYPEQITVTLTDGTELSGTAEEVEEELWNRYDSGFTYETDQAPGKLWNRGTHQVTVSFGNVSSTYDIEVIDNHITDVKVLVGTEETIYYHVNGNFDEETGVFYYDIPEPSLVVAYCDGQPIFSGAFEGISRRLESKYGATPTLTADFDPDWKVGTNQAKFEFAGYSATYDITLAENPVSSITCADTETNGFTYSCDDEVIYNYTCEDVTVETNDGKTFTGSIYEVNEELFELYGWGLETRDEQAEEPWNLGEEREATIYFGDVEAKFNVKVCETYEIVEDEEGDLVYKVDGDIASDYTGYVSSNNLTADITPSLYYVKDGIVDRNHTGIFKVEIEPGVYQWRYYREGVWACGTSGFATDELRSAGGTIYRYRIDGGLVNFHYNGFGEAKADRYYVDGRWQYNYTGFADYTAPNGAITKDCYYVKKGVISQGFKGLYKVNGVYKYYSNGKFQSSTSGFAMDTAKYKETGKIYRYRIDGGLVNKSFTGFAEAGNSRYYKDGLWKNTFTGSVNVGGKTYKVVKGVRV